MNWYYVCQKKKNASFCRANNEKKMTVGGLLQRNKKKSPRNWWTRGGGVWVSEMIISPSAEKQNMSAGGLSGISGRADWFCGAI